MFQYVAVEHAQARQVLAECKANGLVGTQIDGISPGAERLGNRSATGLALQNLKLRSVQMEWVMPSMASDSGCAKSYMG